MKYNETSDADLKQAAYEIEYIKGKCKEIEESEESIYRKKADIKQFYNERVAEAEKNIAFILGESTEIAEIMKNSASQY